MKHLQFFLLLFSLLALIHGKSFSQVDYQKSLDDSKKLGLVGVLSTIKNLSELKMTLLEGEYEAFEKAIYASGESESPLNDAESVLGKSRSNYLVIKAYSDALINQLNADMYVKNRLRRFRKVDKSVKTDKSISPERFKFYTKQLAELENLFLKFQKTDLIPHVGLAGFDDILGVLTLASTMFSEARAFRQTKIDAVSKILEACKLKDLERKEKKQE